MSTAIRGKNDEIQERGVRSTHTLCHALGLENIAASQLKYLTIALAEVAATEVQHNTSFARAVKTRLAEIAATAQKKKTVPPNAVSPKPKLVPIRHVDGLKLIRNGLPDPFVLLEAYGEDQLPLALDEYSATLLKQIARDFEQKYPGTRPGNKNQKASLRDYIVQLVKAHS